MNTPDLILLAIFLFYAVAGLRYGAIRLTIEFGGFVLSFAAALLLYSQLAPLVTAWFHLPRQWANPVSFFVLWSIVEFGYYFMTSVLYNRIPMKLRLHPLNTALSIVPSLLKAAVLSAFVLTLLVSFPIRGDLKKEIFASKIAKPLIRLTSRVDTALSAVFDGALKDTLTFLTIRPASGERLNIGFTVKDGTIDASAEERMLERVNAERVQYGLRPLLVDPKLREVARRHSRDMFERGYFAHTNPDGEEPCDRVTEGGVQWTKCGENIAYAPDVDVAHTGLMNSPGHRANILDGEFGRVGIGVVDGGPYGKMFTQNFAD